MSCKEVKRSIFLLVRNYETEAEREYYLKLLKKILIPTRTFRTLVRYL